MSITFSARWLCIGALALALPIAASAQQAFTRGSVNLRAGPSNQYPSIARLAPGQPVQVMGCTGGYGWCDVVLPDGLRGWAAATRLDYPYGGGYVPLSGYGASIGVPIVAFSIGNYWGNYYRDRPWYNEPRWWGGRPPPPPVPGWRPPPPPHAGWQPRPPGPGYVPPPRPPGPGYGPPPNHGPRPGYDPRPHPGYAQQPGYAPRPGYAPQPGFAPQPGPGANPGRSTPVPVGPPRTPGQYTEPMKDIAPGVPANKF
ncbi:SH3 domain-containing protein [Variovorax robiniae]|uniref:SH3 domain-containing protein n=1 Tax=Variovorax robiniae TaxID=1836199 RepID=A0ABU8XB04_9BURK